MLLDVQKWSAAGGKKRTGRVLGLRAAKSLRPPLVEGPRWWRWRG
jgi:hypothetical protein